MKEEICSSETSGIAGGALLIAGCCIGAAMLGLPVLSASAGFFPSLFVFLLGWLFMTTTGLLFLEVNLWYREETNIVTMAERTLGSWGKVAAWFLFLYLFYSLMVSYTQGAEILFRDLALYGLGWTIPRGLGGLFFVSFFGILIFLGTRTVDFCNRLLMGGLFGSYLLLVLIGTPHVRGENLLYQHWRVLPLLLPTIVTSFGYHNLLPSLSTYLKHNRIALQKVVWIGTAIPLLLYLVWEFLLIGICGRCVSFREAINSGEMATHLLEKASQSTWVISVAQAFAYFAILTSFLAVAFSFVDFLADGLHREKTPFGKLLLCFLTLAPPYLVSLVYPQIFLWALQLAGLGAVVLFGILPALMVWRGREQNRETLPLVPGGKGTLLVVIAFSLCTIILQYYW